jgi:hypothetical protein
VQPRDAKRSATTSFGKPSHRGPRAYLNVDLSTAAVHHHSAHRCSHVRRHPSASYGHSIRENDVRAALLLRFEGKGPLRRGRTEGQRQSKYLKGARARGGRVTLTAGSIATCLSTKRWSNIWQPCVKYEVLPTRNGLHKVRRREARCAVVFALVLHWSQLSERYGIRCSNAIQSSSHINGEGHRHAWALTMLRFDSPQHAFHCSECSGCMKWSSPRIRAAIGSWMISFDPKMPKVRLLRSSFLRCSGRNCALEQGEDGFPPQKRVRVRSRFSM